MQREDPPPDPGGGGKTTAQVEQNKVSDNSIQEVKKKNFLDDLPYGLAIAIIVGELETRFHGHPFPDYREPPGSPNEYQRTALYWQILAARLFFVVIFENVVVLICIIVKWLVPDIPSELKDQIRRETYITNEIIIKQETARVYRTTSPIEEEKLMNLNEAPSSPEQWDRLLSKSMAASLVDLCDFDEVTGENNSNASVMV